MKRKLPAFILAVGMTAAPVFAKQANRRAESNASSKIEENKKKRVDNSVKRQKQIEAEKKFIKQTEAEISEIVGQPVEAATEEKVSMPQPAKIKEYSEVVVKDTMPVNGIDISDEYWKVTHDLE